MNDARKGTKKAATASAVDGLFGGKATKKKPAAKKSEPQEIVQVPKDLRKEADVTAVYRVLIDTFKKKGELAEKRLKEFLVRWWVERFALTGKRPDMAHFEGECGHFNYLVTGKINFTAEKQDGLEMIGVDVSGFTETSGIKINMDAVVRLGYLEKLQEAIQAMVTQPEHVAEIFEPLVTVKDGLLDALPVLAANSEAGGELADKIQEVLSILDPVVNIKKAEVRGKTDEECFHIVDEMELPAKKQAMRATDRAVSRSDLWVGLRLIWRYEPRGGYGYRFRIPVTVVGLTEQRVHVKVEATGDVRTLKFESLIKADMRLEDGTRAEPPSKDRNHGLT